MNKHEKHTNPTEPLVKYTDYWVYFNGDWIIAKYDCKEAGEDLWWTLGSDETLYEDEVEQIGMKVECPYEEDDNEQA